MACAGTEPICSERNRQNARPASTRTELRRKRHAVIDLGVYRTARELDHKLKQMCQMNEMKRLFHAMDTATEEEQENLSRQFFELLDNMDGDRKDEGH